MYVRISVAILFLTFLIANAIAALVPYVDAPSKSPYKSGYDHGCDDADISDPDDRYINQPEKGPSFHTNEFMDGYNDGYDACSSGGDFDGSESSDEPDGSGRINCDANPDDAFCNSEKGRDGLPFCDIVRNAGSCYDRNDNPEEYCEKYREDDKDFCRIIEGTDDNSSYDSGNLKVIVTIENACTRNFEVRTNDDTVGYMPGCDTKTLRVHADVG